MPLYLGMKDKRVIVTNAENADEAYHAIGKKLGIDAADTGNIDLDAFAEVPFLKAGHTKELFEDRLG